MNVYPIFLLRSTGARSAPSPYPSSLPPVPFAALACSNVSAPRFSCLKFRSYPHFPRRVSSIFPLLKSMPVCSRPFHHACSPNAPSSFPPLPTVCHFSPAFPPSVSPLFFARRVSALGYVPDFRCHCRFPSALAPACAALVCICVSILPVPFFPLALSRLSIAPLLALLRFLLIMIGISLAVIARFASHFTRLMYQSLVASSMRRSILCHLRLCICVSVCSWLPAALKLE